ncbi:phosphatidylethanolamine-binding protein [Paraphysoderma sedebokerense]|nr:phosphatidylethanolamine-binding protein [Paraphysoderma sedebokerense]
MSASRLKFLISAGVYRSCRRYLATNTTPQTSPSPLYNEALKIIQADKQNRLSALSTYMQSAKPDQNDQASKRYESEKLKLESEDIENVRKFRNGEGDMNLPVFQYMANQEFTLRKLPRLIKFAKQRMIFDDLFPLNMENIDVDVRVSLQDSSDIAITEGSFIAPENTLSVPNVRIQPFHGDKKLYTMFLLDLDAVSEDQDSFTELILWQVSNIPISASLGSAPLSLPSSPDSSTSATAQSPLLIHPYIPPHPAYGTKSHRIVLVTCSQTAPISPPAQSSNQSPLASRYPSNFTDLLKSHNLTPRGLTFWKTKYVKNSTVSVEAVKHVYEKILGQNEPKYVDGIKINPLKGIWGL